MTPDGDPLPWEAVREGFGALPRERAGGFGNRRKIPAVRPDPPLGDFRREPGGKKYLYSRAFRGFRRENPVLFSASRDGPENGKFPAFPYPNRIGRHRGSEKIPEPNPVRLEGAVRVPGPPRERRRARLSRKRSQQERGEGVFFLTGRYTVPRIPDLLGGSAVERPGTEITRAPVTNRRRGAKNFPLKYRALVGNRRYETKAQSKKTRPDTKRVFFERPCLPQIHEQRAFVVVPEFFPFQDSDFFRDGTYLVVGFVGSFPIDFLQGFDDRPEYLVEIGFVGLGRAFRNELADDPEVIAGFLEFFQEIREKLPFLVGLEASVERWQFAGSQHGRVRLELCGGRGSGREFFERVDGLFSQFPVRHEPRRGYCQGSLQLRHVEDPPSRVGSAKDRAYLFRIAAFHDIAELLFAEGGHALVADILYACEDVLPGFLSGSFFRF